jgi:hypothetical protein
VLALELLAERKIAEAAERGARILKNSGFDSGFPVHRYSIAEKAKIESRYFGKVLRKLTK